MHALKVALRPESEAPRTTLAGAERGTTNYFNSSISENSSDQPAAQQRLAIVPRIIATHWLRASDWSAAA